MSDNLQSDLAKHCMELEAKLASQQAAHDAEIARLKEEVEKERKQLEPLRAQVAMLHQALHNQIYPPNLSGRSGWAELSEQARNALLNTQATAEQFIADCKRRGAVKALEDAACWFEKNYSSGDVPAKYIRKLIGATSKKAE